MKSSFLAWIVSASLTIASFVEIACNKDTHSIDYTKLSIIFGSTLGIIFIFLVIFAFFKITFKFSYFSKESIQSELVDDLTYIHMNFDKYKNQLAKKS